MEAQPEPRLEVGLESSNLEFDHVEDYEDEDEEDDDDDYDDDYEEEEELKPEFMTRETRFRVNRERMERLVLRLSSERVPVRVNAVIINGNRKTRDSLILSEVEAILRDATNFQELLRAAIVANSRLKRLDIFDSVRISLDDGPLELPGTANVVIVVSEAKNPFYLNLGSSYLLEDRSWSLDGILKMKNLFGFGDAWEGSVSPHWGQAMRFSTGVSFPRLRALATPLSMKVSLVSRDWLKLSSFKGPELGLSVGLLSSGNHNVSYGLSWHMLNDQSQSTSWKNHGHTYFSGFKYSYKNDQIDSAMRPTQGHALAFTTRIGRILPHVKNLHVLNQMFHLHYAILFGIYQSALNVGFSGGFLFPWKNGYLNMSSFSTERFLASGNSSIGGPTSVLGFRAWGLDADEPNDGKPDPIGGYLNLKAFADISFDLPFGLFRELGVYGHTFGRTGCSHRVTANALKELTPQKFLDSFRSSIGVGIVLPTKLIRMEVNYCCVLKQHALEREKAGIQFRFSSSL